MGKSAAETVAVAERLSPHSSSGSGRARQLAQQKFVAVGVESVLALAETTVGGENARKSPIAESITKMAMADASTSDRRLVVITDARQVSAIADFECGILPTEAGFLKRLHRLNLLTPGLLEGTEVQLVFVSSAGIPDRGCPVTLDRERRIRSLWVAALRAGGASKVEVRTGPPVFEERETITKENEKEQSE